jgi:hypothetical protein
MSTDVHNEGGDAWMRNTSLFREWDEMKQEILKHKWYESEKAGRDIGWDRASVDWLVRHGRKRSSRKG